MIVHTRDERGIALVLSLFLMAAMSVIAASLMFMSQTETYSSNNYRLMSQARYGAEAGVQQAANYLLYTYAAPTTAGADPLSDYVATGSPVTYNGNPVVLSGNSAVASNYPIAAVQTAFSAAVQGTLPVGTATVQYRPSAQLLAMQEFTDSSGVPRTIQTWQITSDGVIPIGARTAQVEVTAILEQQKNSSQTVWYAAFATASTCGALSFSGGAVTDSYNSQALVGGNPVIVTSGGNVGTNGNLTDTGGSTINGTLSTPRVGVGNCSNGNVDALTSSGGATVTGGVVQLPQAVTQTAPAPPNPAPPTTGNTINGSATCASAGIAASACNSSSSGVLTLDPSAGGGSGTMTLGDITVQNPTAVLHLKAGTYNINSIKLVGNASLIVDSGPVIFNVMGTGSPTPIDLTGGTVSNTSYNSYNLQFDYAGTGAIKINGGATTAAVIFAPNATATLSGGSNFYGSVVASQVTVTGGVHINFDTNLANTPLAQSYTLGPQMMSAFSWKKF